MEIKLSCHIVGSNKKKIVFFSTQKSINLCNLLLQYVADAKNLHKFKSSLSRLREE